MVKKVSFIHASDFLNVVENQNKVLLDILDKEIYYYNKECKFSEARSLIKINKIFKKLNKKELLSIQNRIIDIESILKSNLDNSLNLVLSGSTTKGTYIHRLSDVDILIMLNKSFFFNKKPEIIQKKVLDILKRSFPEQKIKRDHEAINFFIEKRIKIQFVPVIFKKGKIYFPKREEKTWKKIHPEIFGNLLTKQNKKFNKKISVSIKIIKAIITKFPKKLRLNNHHLEVLMYLFSKESSNKNKDFLNFISNFFFYTSKRIMEPIEDSSKQFEFIDEYMGKSENSKRKIISKKLKEISKQIKENKISL
ncbi:MAG: nucleotidyltransferase [Candidatus Pacearchaeota archaeon]